MTVELDRIVVVGASAAGLSTVEALRRGGFQGELTPVGDEPHLPYDRPPLSKQLLAGQWGPDRPSLRGPEVYAELGVRTVLGSATEKLDPDTRELLLADGTRLGHDALVAATGVRARTVPGIEGVGGAHLLRTLDDALELRRSPADGARLVIVGGGFIGAEAAAVTRDLGCEVTMVTDRPAPLVDTVGDEIGVLLTDLHRERGVQVIGDALVEYVINDGGRACGVQLADGRTMTADAVLVGIGTRPNVEWMAGSGIAVGNGVECDATLHAAGGVWAAGDVASWPDPFSGERLRIEHRTNAAGQGLAVARNILVEHPAPFRSVPYVWSDQYEHKIQIYGRTCGADRMRVVEGELAERRFTALFGRDGRVTAALGVGMVRPLRKLRQPVADRADWDTALAA